MGILLRYTIFSCRYWYFIKFFISRGTHFMLVQRNSRAHSKLNLKKMMTKIVAGYLKESAQFDPFLKDKHFEILATHEVVKATGYFQTRADTKSIQVVRGYTIYKQPMTSYLIEDSLKPSTQSLSQLKNEPPKALCQN